MAANDHQARSSGDHDHAIIDVVDELAADVVDEFAAEYLKNLTSDDLSMPPESCIFRIPTILRRHNERAYAPNAFSIGPFHYKRSPLMEATQRIKERYLRELIIPSSHPSPETRFKDVFKAAYDVRKAARKCYAGPIGMPMKEFIRVMALDGCFIIELFRKSAYKTLRKKDDPVFEMSCLHQFLYHDLIMLENQIPWLVLKTLFNLPFVTHSHGEKSLVQLAIEFFRNILPPQPANFHDHKLPSSLNESKHILDMLRDSLVRPSTVVTDNAALTWQPMPSVTRLKEAGIMFKRGEGSKSILDIKFYKGVLEIPPLLLNETTEPLFRNLIALEQCCPSYEAKITSYAILMDNLINTNADIEILSMEKILENWWSVDEATKFFNELYTDTYVKENYYFDLTDGVNKHCKRRWPKYRTVLMHDYFKHPWAFTSLGAAVFLVVCTFLQTLFTIIK